MFVTKIKNGSRIGWVLVLALWLGACGGGNDKGTGILDLSITDAPVDGADEVVVEFTGVEIQSSGGRHSIDYLTPKTIDLLALQGGLRESLLEDYVLPEGNVSWIRLKVNAEADGVMDSFIVKNGASYELDVPSGSETGLKLNRPFVVRDGDDLDFTIDFDLRKSVHQPNGQEFNGVPVYYLRPTLRLIDTNESGVITGLVDPLVFNGETCSVSAPEVSYGIYLFDGNAATPDDIDSIDPDPVTTAVVSLDASSNYVYTLAFLAPGDYTIAATCVADLDEPDTNDAAVTFVGPASVSVTAGATTSHDFLPILLP